MACPITAINAVVLALMFQALTYYVTLSRPLLPTGPLGGQS